MKKSRAVVSLIVYVLILGLLGYTAIFGVGSDKSGAAESIKLGLDLAGGVGITYQVVGDENPSAEDMNDTIYKLQQRVDGYSTEAQVYQEEATGSISRFPALPTPMPFWRSWVSPAVSIL